VQGSEAGAELHSVAAAFAFHMAEILELASRFGSTGDTTTSSKLGSLTASSGLGAQQPAAAASAAQEASWAAGGSLLRSPSPLVSPRKAGNVLAPGCLGTPAYAESLVEATEATLAATEAPACSSSVKASAKRYAGYKGARVGSGAQLLCVAQHPCVQKAASCSILSSTMLRDCRTAVDVCCSSWAAALR
jgi:hypothetical protein